MTKKLLISTAVALAFGAIGVAHADCTGKGSNADGSNALVGQFRRILTQNQMVDLRQYKKQQKNKLEALAVKRRKDERTLYNLLISPDASSDAVDKALADFNNDQVQLASIKLGVMRYAHKIATDEQKARIDKIFAEQLLSNDSCSLSKK